MIPSSAFNRELGVAVLLTEHRLDAVFPVAIGCWSWTVESSALTARPQKLPRNWRRKRKRNACIMDFPPRYASAASLARTPFPWSVRQARGYLKTILKDAKPQAEEPVKQEPEREDKPGAFLQGGLDALRLHRAGRFARRGIAAI